MARVARVDSVEKAAAFVRRVGIALVHPKADIVLPSLWEAVAGPAPLEWSVREEQGKFFAFTPEFGLVWRAKDELPKKRLACAGKHFAGVVVLVSPELLPSANALTGRSGSTGDFRDDNTLAPLQREVAEVILECGPCTGLDIRRLLGSDDRRRVEAATTALQRAWVITNAGSVEQEHGWPAIALDLVARYWGAVLRRLPSRETATVRLASTVLTHARDVSAADLAAALGWRRREAADVLDALVEAGTATVRDEGGIAVWSPVRAR